MAKRCIVLQNEQLKQKTFWTKDAEVAVGSHCVVFVKGNYHVWVCVQTNSVEEVPDAPWIVQRVDMTTYNKQTERAVKEQTIIDKIHKEVSKIPERIKTQQLATIRPKIGELLTELDALEP